nr:uncharacterized protein LOC749210 isoform X2 [Pan troglodytes]
MASAGARGSPQGAGPSHARVPRHSPVGPIASPASEVEAAIPPPRQNVIKLRAEPRPAAGREKRFYLFGPLPQKMLKSMCAGQRLASEPQDPAAVSLPTSSVPETREASFLSARNSSPPARPSFSSSPQPAASPVLLRSPAATHSPLSPGPPGSLRLSCCLFSPFAGRNKGSAALGGALALAERSSREGSSQRMPRQPSATRLPKGGGPGKSPMQGST